MKLITMMNNLEFNDILECLESIFNDFNKVLTKDIIDEYNNTYNHLINGYEAIESDKSILIQYKRLYNDVIDNYKFISEIIIFDKSGDPQNNIVVEDLMESNINELLNMRVLDSTWYNQDNSYLISIFLYKYIEDKYVKKMINYK